MNRAYCSEECELIWTNQTAGLAPGWKMRLKDRTARGVLRRGGRLDTKGGVIPTTHCVCCGGRKPEFTMPCGFGD